MGNKRTRFTLDMEPALQRRLKVVAALMGITMHEYCLTAVEKVLLKDKAQGAGATPFGQEALERLASLQADVFKGDKVPGDSAELIREARRETRCPGRRRRGRT